ARRASTTPSSPSRRRPRSTPTSGTTRRRRSSRKPHRQAARCAMSRATRGSTRRRWTRRSTTARWLNRTKKRRILKRRFLDIGFYIENYLPLRGKGSQHRFADVVGVAVARELTGEGAE